MGKYIHRLSNIDSLAMVGDCATCGRVKVRLRLGRYYRCRTPDREERGRYAAKHPEFWRHKSRKSAQKWRDANREMSRETSRRYRQENPGKITAYVAERNAAKIRRTPSWANLAEIEKFYEKCPRGMVVDHVTPLRGRFVSGLHVLSNLQYLTPEQNNAKGRTYEPFAESF